MQTGAANAAPRATISRRQYRPDSAKAKPADAGAGI
jgi:hypothetical protein